MSNSKTNYNKLVKERLSTWRTEFEQTNSVLLNNSAIAKEMYNRFGISTSPAKIGEMFNLQSNREVKLSELIALAQLFDIPLWDICEHPNTFSTTIDVSTLVKGNHSKHSNISQLNNHYYTGKYYCYYFKPKHFENHLKPVEESNIEECELTIEIKNGHTTVVLNEMKSDTTFYGEPMPSFTLTGNLYRFRNTEIAYSFIKDETGRRAIALMFTYLNLSADIRYYITAGMMTFSLNQTHEPLFQKMAIFRVRQKYKNPKTEKILRGILALNSGPIILDNEAICKLINEDPTLKQVLSPQNALKKCYVYLESAIKSNSFFILNENERIEKLLDIKRNSLYPAHEIISETDSFTDFIKDFQCQQLNK